MYREEIEYGNGSSMTAPTSERWRSRWRNQDAARRYLGTIQDQGRWQEMADFLGVELKARPSYDPCPRRGNRVSAVPHRFCSRRTPTVPSV